MIEQIPGLVCALIGAIVLGGVAIAAGGRSFARLRPNEGSYREPGQVPTAITTPTRVRAIGVVSVLYGALTTVVLAPCGGLGTLYALDRPSVSTGLLSLLLGLTSLSGLVFGVGVAMLGVNLSRGQKLENADGMARAWIGHHALASTFIVLWAVSTLLDPHSHGERTSAAMGMLVLAVVVLAAGTAHAVALQRAAAAMRSVVGETPRPSR